MLGFPFAPRRELIFCRDFGSRPSLYLFVFQHIANGLSHAHLSTEFAKDTQSGRAGEDTVKIERKTYGERTIVFLAGRIRSEGLDEIGAQIGDTNAKILDLHEVTLVDVDAVRFLRSCEEAGITLARCPPYVREWILRERAEGKERKQ